MSNINSLIEMINNNTEKFTSWTKKLNENISGWEKLFADPLNWDLLEQLKPQDSYSDLCWLILDAAGFDLAERWLNSAIAEQRTQAENWFPKHIDYWSRFNGKMKMITVREFDKLQELINVDIWQGLSEEMKLIFVTELFKNEDMEEPFNYIREHNHKFERVLDLWERLHHWDRHRYQGGSMFHDSESSVREEILDEIKWLTPLALPLILGYYPSISVVRTRIAAEEAGDKTWVQRIDKMIADRENACRNSNVNDYYATIVELFNHGKRRKTASGRSKSAVVRRTKFKLSNECIFLKNRLLEKVANLDFSPDDLPTILHSNETPPIFVEYPDMENIRRNEESKEQKTEFPDTFTIEELLGCYFADQRTIVIFDRGIDWCVKNKHFAKSTLENVVLIHELAHWITHRLPGKTTSNWDLDLFNRTETNVHEGFAQLFTYWIAGEVRGEFKDTFEKLNLNQSSKYHVFKQFTAEEPSEILDSLEALRKLSAPATLEDWKDALMLKTWM